MSYDKHPAHGTRERPSSQHRGVYGSLGICPESGTLPTQSHTNPSQRPSPRRMLSPVARGYAPVYSHGAPESGSQKVQRE
eukprot:5114774-Prymnesium_polylepis.1